MSEEIRHAAVKSKCGMILLGKSHSCCFRQGAGIGLKMSSSAADQGFMTSEGRFVERPEAAKIAVSAGQIPGEPSILFSEDFWSEQYGGRFKYDYIKGYYKDPDAERANDSGGKNG
jgi:hypothetical protein